MIKTCLKCQVSFKTRNSKRKYCSHPCYAIAKRGTKDNGDRKGYRNGNWKGGKRKDKDGYIVIHSPYHPFCSSDGYVREHRLIMERSIKRFLTQNEIIHHLNEIKDDNRLENLQLMDRKDHDRANAESRRANGFKIENFNPKLKQKKVLP